MKKYTRVLLVVSIILALFVVVGLSSMLGNNTKQKNTTTEKQTTLPDIQNNSYTIDDEIIPLKEGVHEEKIPDSASIERTEIVKSASGEINSDTATDTAVILVQSGGGTGIFYSISVVYSSGTEYKTTPAVFLGDRIIIKNVSINKTGTITVSYLDRKESDPMSADPTVLMSSYFILKNKALIEK